MAHISKKVKAADGSGVAVATDKHDDRLYNHEEAVSSDPPGLVVEIIKEEDQDALSKIQENIDSYDTACLEEIEKVNQKYEALKLPVIEKRNAIFEKIKGFWSRVLTRHPVIGSLVDENDIPAMNYLKSVSLKGNKLSFFFEENPYFENTELWKDYIMESKTDVDEVDQKISVSVINWKNGPIKGTAYLEGTEDNASFFDWFKPSENDTEVIQLFRSEIWPDPLDWYLSTKQDIDEAFYEEDSNDLEDDEIPYDDDEEDENEEDALEQVGDDEEDASEDIGEDE